MGARGSERGGRVGRRLGSELGLVEEGGREGAKVSLSWGKVGVTVITGPPPCDLWFSISGDVIYREHVTCPLE